MAAVRIHQANDQSSAEVMAGRLRAEGIPAQVIRSDVSAPYAGAGLSAGFDILVPEHLSRQARRALGARDEVGATDRRGYYALIVLAIVALVVFALAVLQRSG